MDLIWDKPVIVFYKENLRESVRKAFAIVKANRLVILKKEIEKSEFSGSIEDFFPLMGDVDYISSNGGVSEQYILCWFDDNKNNLLQVLETTQRSYFSFRSHFLKRCKG